MNGKCHKREFRPIIACEASMQYWQCTLIELYVSVLHKVIRAMLGVSLQIIIFSSNKSHLVVCYLDPHVDPTPNEP